MHRGLYSPRCNGASSLFSIFRCCVPRLWACKMRTYTHTFGIAIPMQISMGFVDLAQGARSRLHGTTEQPRYEAAVPSNPFRQRVECRALTQYKRIADTQGCTAVWFEPLGCVLMYFEAIGSIPMYRSMLEVVQLKLKPLAPFSLNPKHLEGLRLACSQLC